MIFVETIEKMLKIAIIGAGVCGTTTATRLQEQFGKSVSITIFSDKFSPDTTGDVSAGNLTYSCE